MSSDEERKGSQERSDGRKECERSCGVVEKNRNSGVRLAGKVERRTDVAF